MTSSDLCIGFFTDIWNAGKIAFSQNARVLEIGCAEADWMTPMLAERPDLQITGIDWRPPVKRPGTVLQGDVLTYPFERESFEAIVSVSTIEHIGLSAYGDPDDPDGDTHAMERLWDWLVPGGVCYLDVPYTVHGEYQNTGKYRRYDELTLHERLIGPSGLCVDYEQTFAGSHEGPYIALVLSKG